jgi:hypothetical protein
VNDNDDEPFLLLNPPVLTARALFAEAREAVVSLGTQPRSNPLRWCWEEERRGTLDRLASLAGHDSHLLRRGALHLATGPRHRHREAAALLTEATRFAWPN